ncbi:glucokinase [Blastococcus aggregatus]|uniref:Glucokinase n=1 Tax=Blastococcus aggregatus TaxID=38502 RepID=A0A285V3I8_9ACTN|nr:ROK family protein [Blastococcus aggregatus]SOC48672.1 glucokinase [Blastococcus aggregatus]
MSPGGGTRAIGVDVGGTKIAAGVVGPDGLIGELTRVPTPPGPGVDDAIVAVVEPLLATGDVVAVGLSVAGFVRADRRSLVFSPNIDGWLPGDLAGAVESRLDRPVVVENDANCAAWGEAVHGVGQGATTTVCLTVGTGLGGGLVIDGRLHRGFGGFAAEYGHMALVPDGLPCGCGGVGCWEQYVSGAALVRAYLAHQGAGPDAAVSGRAVTEAAENGDQSARAAFGTVGTALGRGMAVLGAALDPELYVIGGGVADAGALLLDPVREAYEAALTPRQLHRTPARVELAALGSAAGVIGAGDLARRHAEEGPARGR